MIKADHWIRKMALEHDMIYPFVERSLHGISYGLSSYGYDIRLASEFKIFQKVYDGIIDPKKINERVIAEVNADQLIIPPHGFVLGRSIETFRVPREVACIVIGKSTYARCGLILNCTPLEPEWEGTITLELHNTTELPVLVYAYEGIGQVLFFVSDSVCEISYADKKGKYQNQTGVTLPKVTNTP